MNQIKMEVNKKNATTKKYELVGAVDIFVPTLHEVFPDLKPKLDEKGQEIVEDGLPVYEDDKHNYIQGAIYAAVKAQARNKLVSGTATLKDGVQIASDWVQLTAEGERGGNGEALAIVREAKAAFATYVASLKKSVNAQATLNMLFSNKQALALQAPENKAKMEQYVTGFAESLKEEQLARFEKYITSVLEAATADTGEVDDF